MGLTGRTPTVLRRLAVAMAALLLLTAPAATAAGGAPTGYELVSQRQVRDGVAVLRLVRPGAPLVVDVARVAPDAGTQLRVVVSGDTVGGPGGTPERTSSMCRRVDCVVAVNADFALPGSGLPVGGVVRDGQILRTPVASHHQVSLLADGGMRAGGLEWSGRLMPSDLRPLAVNGINVPRGAEQLVLYTPPYAAATGTNEFGAELVLRMRQPAGPVRIGQTTLVELESLADGSGNTPIPRDGAVLSGHGAAAAALRDLWGRVQAGAASRRALLRLETAPAVAESTGGTPVLVHEGRRWVAGDGSGFASGRHPRTMVGWTAAGEILLVTVDGRQPDHSIGMTLPEAADLMVALGAVEALNLDGGGSTTFVAAGAVVNRPSDRLVRRRGRERIVAVPARGDTVVGHVERPVTTALAIVAAPQESPPPADPLAGESPLATAPVPEVRELALPAPVDDPASDPAGARPALLVSPVTPAPSNTWEVAAAVLLLLAAGATTGVWRRAARAARAP